jgi:hypothetical protein
LFGGFAAPRVAFSEESIMETNVVPKNRERWNKGKLVGQKAPLRPKDIWALRVRMQLGARVRDLAMFNLAFDSKLRGCDLIALRVRDVSVTAAESPPARSCCSAKPSAQCSSRSLSCVGRTRIGDHNVSPNGLGRVRDLRTNRESPWVQSFRVRSRTSVEAIDMTADGSASLRATTNGAS